RRRMETESVGLPEFDEVTCPGNAARLEDCCVLVQIGEGRSLWEWAGDTRSYWISIVADETPVVLCALDKYATAMKWNERRSDGVAIGWCRGNCYVVFIELRLALTREEQFEDKADQVESAMQLLCQVSDKGREHHEKREKIFEQACDDMSKHRIAGVVIPVDHSKSRARQARETEIGGKKAVILAISSPRDRLLRWSDLCRAMGVG
ncbi:MAG: hypothetical protein JXA14_11050, partial [Anaerolineae bacterium]|nr:hypothetical protein [Anaerolineae bacterium]